VAPHIKKPATGQVAATPCGSKSGFPDGF